MLMLFMRGDYFVTTAIKQRIVGAIFILSLGVILIPVILDKPQVGHAQEQEMLSHVIPDTPALPDVSEVSKIHYVFNDAEPDAAEVIQHEPQTQLQPESQAELQSIASASVHIPEETKPQTVSVSSNYAVPSSLEPAMPLPPEMAQNESNNPFPDPVEPIAPALSKGHAQASATLAEASQAEWTIQLGAFSSEKNAKALVQKLSKGGFDPYLRQMTQDSLVRVYVSPGISRDQAIDLAGKLDSEYGLKGIVVRYFQ